MSTGRESTQFLLRLPDGMRDRLKAEAEANKRSMNAEIVERLEATLKLEKDALSDPGAFLIEQLKKTEEKHDTTLREIARARREYEEARLAAEVQTAKMLEVRTYLESFHDFVNAVKSRQDELTHELKLRLKSEEEAAPNPANEADATEGATHTKGVRRIDLSPDQKKP